MFVSVESTLVSPGGTSGYSGKGEPGGAGYLGNLPVPMHLANFLVPRPSGSSLSQPTWALVLVRGWVPGGRGPPPCPRQRVQNELGPSFT